MSQFNINNLCSQNVQINGRNVRINGRDVTYDEGRKIDERKVISEKGIENISIQSSLADVNITTSDSSVMRINLLLLMWQHKCTMYICRTTSNNCIWKHRDFYSGRKKHRKCLHSKQVGECENRI